MTTAQRFDRSGVPGDQRHASAINFDDRDLLKRGAHPWQQQRTARRPTIERLEFLGDRVLGLVIAEELYRRNPATPEGSLLASISACWCAARPAPMVRANARHQEHIRLGRKETAAGHAPKTSASLATSWKR